MSAEPRGDSEEISLWERLLIFIIFGPFALSFVFLGVSLMFFSARILCESLSGFFFTH